MKPLRLDDARRSRLTAFLGRHEIPCRDLALVHQALVHRSFANEAGRPDWNNERLELLGDGLSLAVLAAPTRDPGRPCRVRNRPRGAGSSP